MKVKMNTNLVRMFNGTYYTGWEIYDEGLRPEYDFDEFMQSIVDAYQDNKDFVISELDMDFIKSIDFDGFYTPREYNFKTDQLDFVLEIDKNKLIDTVNNLKGNEEFNQWLRDNFTSRDGFMSFTPNNYKELAEAIKTEGDKFHQALGALITWLSKTDGISSKLESIDDWVRGEWIGNGYYGLVYKLFCDVCDKQVEWDHEC